MITVNKLTKCSRAMNARTTSKPRKLIRARRLPVAAELDLNDLEGRTDDPTVKSLKTQYSIEILSITPI